MKIDFGILVKDSKRFIVIHHCHEIFDKILPVLQPYDMVFFDDCLYSQYKFLKQYNYILKEKHITCVLGFSAALHRRDINTPIFDIKSDVIHKKCNEIIYTYKDTYTNYFDELNGFMHLDEIKELLKESNIYLACHGACHLHLEETRKEPCHIIDKVIKFDNDLVDAIMLLKDYNLITNIYVYPYAYSCNNFFEKCLQKRWFLHIFANDKPRGNRISIESLL